MELIWLPSNSRKLLSEIVSADKPAALLREKFKNATVAEDMELRGILHELVEKGFLQINWGDDVPDCVIVNNAARTYEEQLAEFERLQNQSQRGIIIGNNNRIRNSVIAESVSDIGKAKKKTFFEKHPVICGLLISLVAGIILLFSFWQQLIQFIEGLF